MSTRNEFPAGLVLDAHKQLALQDTIIEVPPPRTVVLSLDQGSGRAAEPAVAVGAHVARGTVVARPTDRHASVLHSPISGNVHAIERRDTATGDGRGVCIVIENDGSDARDGSATPCPEYASLAPDALIERLRDAGFAGLGGAGFPTSTKLFAARERGAQRLLLNGAECEPWICSDDALMREHADDILRGAQVLQHALDAAEGIVAVEDDKPAAIAALRAALAHAGAMQMSLSVVPSVFPQGAERQLVTAVMGVEVPSGGFPPDVGVTCHNVATAAAIGRWARTGEPCVARVVTVTGHGVARPRNVLARIGTPIADLVDTAGGYHGEPVRLIAGGTMTGRALPSDEVGITKSMNCVLVATREDIGSRLGAQELPCIRCGDCASVCPAGLLPQQIHRAALVGDEAGLLDLGVQDCIDCGCCDFVCPSQIPLAWRFREARERLQASELAASRAASARARFERRQRRLSAAAETEQQAFDAARAEALRAAATPTETQRGGG